MSNANVTLIESLYAAFGRGEIATIIAALSPDIDWTLNGSRKDYPLLAREVKPWPGLVDVEPMPGDDGDDDEAAVEAS